MSASLVDTWLKSWQDFGFQDLAQLLARLTKMLTTLIKIQSRTLQDQPWSWHTTKIICSSEDGLHSTPYEHIYSAKSHPFDDVLEERSWYQQKGSMTSESRGWRSFERFCRQEVNGEVNQVEEIAAQESCQNHQDLAKSCEILPDLAKILVSLVDLSKNLARLTEKCRLVMLGFVIKRIYAHSSQYSFRVRTASFISFS